MPAAPAAPAASAPAEIAAVPAVGDAGSSRFVDAALAVSTRPELTEPFVQHGILGVEMEAAGLYTLAAYYGRRALAICTVSDHIVTGEETTAQEREQTFGDMIRIALRAATA